MSGVSREDGMATNEKATQAISYTELAERELQQELAWFLEKVPEPGKLRMIEWWGSQARKCQARVLELEAAYKREREWRTKGIVELAVENRSVSDYIEHWEGRALRAEAAREDSADEQSYSPRKREGFTKLWPENAAAMRPAPENSDKGRGEDSGTAPTPLNEKQSQLVEWGTKCFGAEHMADPKIRALRLLEESIEFAQAVDAPIQQCRNLVDYVYSRPTGKPKQELGGIGVTWLVAAAALGESADNALRCEMERISNKAPEHFAARNQAKCDAGFVGAEGAVPEKAPTRGNKILEAISNALSKLESQVMRNPDLPEAYRTILAEGYAARNQVQWLLSNLCPKHQELQSMSTGECAMCRLAAPAVESAATPDAEGQ